MLLLKLLLLQVIIIAEYGHQQSRSVYQYKPKRKQEQAGWEKATETRLREG